MLVPVPPLSPIPSTLPLVFLRRCLVGLAASRAFCNAVRALQMVHLFCPRLTKEHNIISVKDGAVIHQPLEGSYQKVAL